MGKTVKTEFVGLRIDPATVSRLDQLAQKTGENRSETIRKLIDQAAQQPPQPKKAER